DALNKKYDLERKFAAMVAKDANLKATYGGVLEKIKSHYAEGKKYLMARSMIIEFYFVGPEILRFTQGFNKVAENWEQLSKDGKLNDEIERLRSLVDRFYKNYQPFVDEQVLGALYPMYIEALAPNLRPDIHSSLSSKYGTDWQRMAKETFAKSAFTSRDRLNALLDKLKSKGGAKKIQKDPAYKLGKSVFAAWRQKAAPSFAAFDAELSKMMRVYVKGLMTLFPDRRYWPDANSTLRLSYGQIEGSEPRDGVVYNAFTTLDGVLAKYVPGDREFDLPEKLIRLGKTRDYGQYADKEGNLPVCFTASNHTTGGNSGSPVLDGYGRLIGINFDRSWESTMSDIMYDPERCRNIIVDIRYVLFIVDKYAGATHLIKEMEIVK
ncbi:MAG: S46 family peptidase, partial [Bacteroidota bacterium]